MSNANVALIQGLYAAFGRGDVADIIASLAPDVHWESGGRRSDFPTFGPRKGPSEVQGFFSQVAENFDFSDFTPREFCPSDDKVFVPVAGTRSALLQQLGVVPQLGAKAA